MPRAPGTLQSLEEEDAKARSRLLLSWTTSQACSCNEQPGSKRSNLPRTKGRLGLQKRWPSQAQCPSASTYTCCLGNRHLGTSTSAPRT